MAERLLKFSRVVAAGDDARGYLHIYYGCHYVGCILPGSAGWRVWFKEIGLGEFDSLESAQSAVAQWYYGPEASSTIR
jgi:hypothetical protein